MALLAVFLLVFLMAIGVPVAWSFAAVLAYLIFIFDVNTTTLLLQGVRSLDSIILLALPLFIFAGYLMRSGGIAKRLIDFVDLFVGHYKGGLGGSMIIASAVFGAIAGTATAAVAAIGTVMIGPMEKRGYPRGYSSALLGFSSLLGIMIPPSITLILFGVITRQSITALFAATIGPALLLIIFLLIFNRFIGYKCIDDQARLEATRMKRDTRKYLKTTFAALPALSMPFLILGGIYGGVFTPTEAAAVAAVASLFIGLFIYKDMTLKSLYKSIIESAETTGSIMLILIFSFMIGKILVAQRLPQDISAFVTATIGNPFVILLLVNVFLVAAGMIMDDVSVTVVIAPILLPLMTAIGIDPIHYGAIVASSVVIGANSPPVAVILYLACRIGNVSIHRAVVPAIYLIVLVGLPVLLATTFFPNLSLFFPRLLGVY